MLIYEASSSSSIIPHLSQAFQQTGGELTHVLPLASSSCSLNDKLKKQKRQVFIIHASLELGIRLFQTAERMEMTGDGYLWLATNEITDLFHSINSTMTSSLKGMVGVTRYLPENIPAFLNFQRKFRSEYPEEEQDEPGIFAVQGYSAVKLLEIDFPENLHNWRPLPATSTEIVSMIGKGYHSVPSRNPVGLKATFSPCVERGFPMPPNM
ncbi:Extracellular ligand-binding receptor [Cynara cardunculus var. scolymus]|uniref:Extracellular ligand-binding receptor n=1 Tax=Cynara cardunculus var. scolymus TaxID=59895 RepID=A0A103XLV4_CYNCS|nr:Extracellular ligand-binding receptor [Cynara cardunculus var. scolymus]